MIRNIRILIIALLLAVLVSGTALAFMPTTKGASYHTVYLDRGIKGSVSGKVVSSADQGTGIQGAYVAVVDAMNTGTEYANATTDANGNFNIGGLGATYTSTKKRGPDGSAGTMEQGMNMFMLYANKSGIGEGYSGTFGIDANHTSTPMGNIVIYAGASSDGEATPGPTAAPTVLPTVFVPTPGPTVFVPTPEPPAATPEPTVTSLTGQIPIGLIAVIVALIVLAIAAVVVYFKFLRQGLMRKFKKK